MQVPVLFNAAAELPGLPDGAQAGDLLMLEATEGGTWRVVKVPEGFALPEGGAVGQILVRTADGYAWSDLPADVDEVPDAGTTGYFLTKTSGGTAWTALPNFTTMQTNITTAQSTADTAVVMFRVWSIQAYCVDITEDIAGTVTATVGGVTKSALLTAGMTATQARLELSTKFTWGASSTYKEVGVDGVESLLIYVKSGEPVAIGGDEATVAALRVRARRGLRSEVHGDADRPSLQDQIDETAGRVDAVKTAEILARAKIDGMAYTYYVADAITEETAGTVVFTDGSGTGSVTLVAGDSRVVVAEKFAALATAGLAGSPIKLAHETTGDPDWALDGTIGSVGFFYLDPGASTAATVEAIWLTQYESLHSARITHRGQIEALEARATAAEAQLWDLNSRVYGSRIDVMYVPADDPSATGTIRVYAQPPGAPDGADHDLAFEQGMTTEQQEVVWQDFAATVGAVYKRITPEIAVVFTKNGEALYPKPDDSTSALKDYVAKGTSILDRLDELSAP